MLISVTLIIQLHPQKKPLINLLIIYILNYYIVSVALLYLYIFIYIYICVCVCIYIYIYIYIYAKRATVTVIQRQYDVTKSN